MKNHFYALLWIINKQLHIRPRKIIQSLQGLPRFIRNYRQFKCSWDGKISLKPCLYDWNDAGGEVRSEYFLQDLLIARKIYTANPLRHVDIGSRVDGFVAHIASFRDIEIMDIRPIDSNIPGIIFKQADLMNFSQKDYCDSLSCLHALEHFGLGRYGDAINPEGYKLALSNMANLLKADGLLYLSTPVGAERVEFNAHRVFDPINLVSEAKKSGLELSELASINMDMSLDTFSEPNTGAGILATRHYSLGLFIFKKIKSTGS